MGREPQRKRKDRDKPTGQGSGRGNPARSTHTPVTSLRIPSALLARADELVPVIAATGEQVNARRSMVLRLALTQGLRVLARRYGHE